MLTFTSTMAKRKRKSKEKVEEKSTVTATVDGEAVTDESPIKKTPKPQQNQLDDSTANNHANDQDTTDPSKWSKSKKKRMRKLKHKKPQDASSSNASTTKSSKRNSDSQQQTENANEPATKKAKTSTSSLVESFKARLSGSRFRILNEELYTTPSNQSFARFKKNPQLFQEYHDGFRHQVESWPVNPISVMVQKIHAKYTRDNEQVVVADFGCGEAQLAKQLLEKQQQQRNKNKFQVHSFDLVQPTNPETRHLVTPCDMAHVPLPDASVDVGIFCLALMGTNLADFIREAHRVLKPSGTVWIAEVQSRFFEDTKNKNPNSGKDASLQSFLRVLANLGFKCVQKDLSNKMFFLLQLTKNGKTPQKKLTYTAKPCIYKRR